MNGFILHLQGPMQSAADTGFGQIREAGPFPSRAAVIGVIAAAMGIERGGTRLLDLHRDLRIHVAAVQIGTLGVDYHTVLTAGYAEHDPVLLRREGVAGANPVLTDRSYHLDAHFVALVESHDTTLIEECREALHHPVFTGYLGRRSCVPATPLLPVVPEGSERLEMLYNVIAESHALRQKARKKPDQDSLTSFVVWTDGDISLGATWCDARAVAHSYRRDLLVALPRSYVNRPVTHLRVMLPAAQSGGSSTSNEEFYHAAP